MQQLYESKEFGFLLVTHKDGKRYISLPDMEEILKRKDLLDYIRTEDLRRMKTGKICMTEEGLDSVLASVPVPDGFEQWITGEPLPGFERSPTPALLPEDKDLISYIYRNPYACLRARTSKEWAALGRRFGMGLKQMYDLLFCIGMRKRTTKSGGERRIYFVTENERIFEEFKNGIREI